MRHGAADAAVGIMEGAYFASRSEILDFFNSILDMSLTKIEQTATGAVACQLTEIIFPGSIPMKKVNWEAKASHEFIPNYKLLQAAFDKNRVQRHVEVDKLIRAKYQDNLEFCQWIKAFYEQTGPGVRPADDGEAYDPLSVRMKGKGGRNLPAQFQSSGGGSRPPPARVSSRAASASKIATRSPETKRMNRTASSPVSEVRTTEQIIADANLMKKNAELTRNLTEVEETLQGIERERDFYFEKLRGIEILLQVYQEGDGKDDETKNPVVKTLVDKVFKVLYATSDDNVVVREDGEVVGSFEVAGATSDSSDVMKDAQTELDEIIDEEPADDLRYEDGGNDSRISV